MTGQPNKALENRRVLVVEDEYFIADDIARALTRLGAEVVGPVADPDDALAALAEGKRIDFAVLDINLQGQNVFPVADALLDRGLPFVFATGYHQAVLPGRYQGVPYWEKPFDPDRLARALSRLIAAS